MRAVEAGLQGVRSDRLVRLQLESRAAAPCPLLESGDLAAMRLAYELASHAQAAA